MYEKNIDSYKKSIYKDIKIYLLLKQNLVHIKIKLILNFISNLK